MSRPSPNSEEELSKAKKYYSEQNFWSKLKKATQAIGKEALEKLLILYYCFQDENTPSREKAIILGALGYFIMPFDLIPDLLPGGWTDDLSVLALAIAKVTRAINDKHIEKARDKLNKLTDKA